MKKGKLIVFEGIDGSGKSTQCKSAYKYLLSKGVKCALTVEPTDGEIGRLLRKYLKGEHCADPYAVAALFAADRIDHITKEGGINDLLSQGVTVLCDRYYLSSCAYQGTECDMDFVLRQNAFAIENCKPDLCIFIDLTPEISMQRVRARGDCEIFENNEKQIDIYKNYMKLFESRSDLKVVRVDGSESIDGIAEKIRMILDGFLSERS